jgi:16S rRNA (guanine527-N7)-methyltransferase
VTEGDARAWIAARFGAPGIARMEQLVGLVRSEAVEQNLVSASTLDAMWARHIVDSAQLIALADKHPGLWIDIGTGAGFPGLVVAALTERRILLVEPRKRRADFLRHCCQELAFPDRVDVVGKKVESVAETSAVISARAVARLETLFTAAQQCSTWNTLWLLPKGQAAQEEIANARLTWHGRFHVEQSVTDDNSLIVIAKEVSRR